MAFIIFIVRNTLNAKNGIAKNRRRPEILIHNNSPNYDNISDYTKNVYQMYTFVYTTNYTFTCLAFHFVSIC